MAVLACGALAWASGATAAAAVAVPAHAGLGLSVVRQLAIGDGTAVLSVRLPGRGTLTVTQPGGDPLLQPLQQRVGKAGSLTLVLKPTAAARALERRGRPVHLTALLTFRPVAGISNITSLIPIVFDIKMCTPGLTFYYTGAEQACVVPQTPKVSPMTVLVAGGHGGSGAPGCFFWASFSGQGGRGAQLRARIPVTPGETLYIEVGGDGTDGINRCAGRGAPGFGGWNGGGNGALPPSQNGSGGGGGASDIRTVSCAAVCDQLGGFGVFLSLVSRIVVAGGGGGGGSGGIAAPCVFGSCSFTTGGDGGDAGWSGLPVGAASEPGQNGRDATISGTTGITGAGGAGGGTSAGGAGGMTDPYCGSPGDPPPCTWGGDGLLAIGGYGGNDPWIVQAPVSEGYAGGGGGAGYWGGGGGDGGAISQADTVGGGGGGGGGSSFGPPGLGTTSYFLNYGQPEVEIVS